MEWLTERVEIEWREMALHLSSPEFYIQIFVVALALAIGCVAAIYITRHLPYRDLPALYRARALVQPVSAAISLGIASEICEAVVGEAWLVNGAQGIAFIFVVYSLARHLLRNATIIALLKWVGLPIALLYSVGWLDDVIQVEEVKVTANEPPGVFNEGPDFTEVRDVQSVAIREDRETTLKILFDAEHNLEERILREQFLP